jgi:hypothetical protein
MLHTDPPVPWRETLAWAEYLWPAGFRGAIGAGLFTADGRHVGHVTLLAGSPSTFTTVERDAVGDLLPMIAHAIDRMRSIGAAPPRWSRCTAPCLPFRNHRVMS